MLTHDYIKSRIIFFETKSGGRHCMPEGDDYAPYIRVKGDSKEFAVRVYGVPKDSKFGDQIEVTLELIYHPKLHYGHFQLGVAFEILEGSKIIGEGIVSSAIYKNAAKIV